MSFIKRANCGFVALGLCLAMAAPTFGGDIVGLHTIEAGYPGLVGTTYTNNDARLAPNPGDTTTIIITDGYTFSSGGETRFGEKGAAATLTVEFGGILDMPSEMIWNEDEQGPQQNRLNAYGTAYVEQLKMYGIANDDIATVGNGTDAATLTIKEGLLGKEGDASITINELGTMSITEDWGFEIDENGDGNDAYIDLVGGTLKVNSGLDASGFDSNIKGFGVLDNWVMNAGTGNDAGFNIYTAVPADVTPVPEPASIAIWSFLGICLAGYGYRRRRRNS